MIITNWVSWVVVKIAGWITPGTRGVAICAGLVEGDTSSGAVTSTLSAAAGTGGAVAHAAGYDGSPGQIYSLLIPPIL